MYQENLFELFDPYTASFLSAIGLACVVYGVLRWTNVMETRLSGPCLHSSLRLFYRDDGGKGLLHLAGILDDHGVPENARRWSTDTDGRHCLDLNFCRAHRQHRAIVRELAILPVAIQINVEKVG